ncbi:2OG-Fe dioxygenase family protein [Nocardia shimofusensis]|uniref:2OG-Fe dioxygenase family protein n=1 Tax=Nocardia shimofusensis TaxID=228596 RepID=UPI00082A7B99|nr:2OG-Fe dioxygenase family protein [Nocardia shimofusensis]
MAAQVPHSDRRLVAARRALVARGVHLVPAAVTTSLLGVANETWERFRAHWDELGPDTYAAEQGTCRLRRYGRFAWSAATDRVRLLPRADFVQPENSNPLYIGVSRTLEPLTESFAADPVLRAALRLLGQVATALDDPAEWIAKVHPFRVIASEDANGLPTPEGRHRDGVTLVSSLLIGRHNAAGGESAVFDPDGRRLLTITLDEPGTLLLGDDRRTLHSVSAIRPVDRSHPAYRDVLVVTFAPG